MYIFNALINKIKAYIPKTPKANLIAIGKYTINETIEAELLIDNNITPLYIENFLRY